MTKLKVLIVDDESFARDSIRYKIDYHSFNFEMIHEAASGSMALEMMQQNHYDIIITDIKMPEMDGLELITRAQKESSCFFILVSGYDEFEYARKALQLGVSEYLLKPVKKELLNHTISMIVEKIMIKEKEAAHLIKLEKAYSVQQLMDESYTYNQILWKEKDKKNISQWVKMISNGWIDSFYQVIVIHFRNKEERGGAINTEKYNVIKYAARKYLRSSNTKMIFNLENANELIMLCSYSDQEKQSNLQDELFLLQQDLHHQLKEDIAIGIGDAITLLERAGQSYQEALVACRNKIIKGYNKLFIFSQISIASEEPLKINKEEMDLIIYYIKNKKIHKVKEEIEKIIYEYALKAEAYGQYIHMLMTIYFHIKQAIDNYQPQEDERVFIQQLYHIDNISDMKYLFLDKMDDIFQQKYSEESVNLDGEKIVALAVKYIAEHYEENITLDRLAEKYHIHPNYLSRIFKKYCDYNFNDYLTRVRMQKAEQLLTIGEAKVIEVAEILGYSDAKYFSKVFKKYYGVSPGQLSAKK